MGRYKSETTGSNRTEIQPAITAEIKPTAISNRLSKLFRYAFGFGYSGNDGFSRALYNKTLAAGLILCSAPLLIGLYLAVLCSSGRPVIYSGKRLGKNRKQFYIYKFRTLKPEAGQITQYNVLPERSDLETGLGKILRETRMDELPQLFNVLAGDMNLFGPRPVRPEIAKIQAGNISNYEDRFKIKPGLVGQTQIFMPHSATKKIRARANAIFQNRPSNIARELTCIALVAIISILKLRHRVWERIKTAKNRRQYEDRRSARRVEPVHAELHVVNECGSLTKVGKITNMNDEAIAYQVIAGFPVVGNRLVLTVHCSITGQRKRALCNLLEWPTPESAHIKFENSGVGDEIDYSNRQEVGLVFYSAASPLNTYMIDKYFLNKCFILS